MPRKTEHGDPGWKRVATRCGGLGKILKQTGKKKKRKNTVKLKNRGLGVFGSASPRAARHVPSGHENAAASRPLPLGRPLALPLGPRCVPSGGDRSGTPAGAAENPVTLRTAERCCELLTATAPPKLLCYQMGSQTGMSLL